MEFLIITGLSGAGKTRAADICEDLGYYCVDNLPAALLGRFAALCLATRGRYERVALVMDVRSVQSREELDGALAELAVQTGVLAGLFCLVYKLLFPRGKVRRLFRRRNLKWLFLGAFTVTAANALLCQLWPDWPALRALLLTAAGFGVLCLLWRRLCGRLRAPTPRTVRTELTMDFPAANY